MNTPDTNIIISTFNEEENIETAVREAARAMPSAEIVVVDGGTDRTYERACALREEIPNLVVIKNENDRGKGHAIRTGVSAAKGRYMAQFDADLQFSADDLPALIAPVREGRCDVCVGSRFLKSSNRDAYKPIFYRDLGNRFLSVLMSLLTGRKVTDVTSGMKAWSREAMARIAFEDDRYSYEAEIIIKAAVRGLRLQEVPVSYASRDKGESMHRSVWALFRAGATIAIKSIRWRWKS